VTHPVFGHTPVLDKNAKPCTTNCLPPYLHANHFGYWLNTLDWLLRQWRNLSIRQSAFIKLCWRIASPSLHSTSLGIDTSRRPRTVPIHQLVQHQLYSASGQQFSCSTWAELWNYPQWRRTISLDWPWCGDQPPSKPR